MGVAIPNGRTRFYFSSFFFSFFSSSEFFPLFLVFFFGLLRIDLLHCVRWQVDEILVGSTPLPTLRLVISKKGNEQIH